jgi:hypothetical protein
MSSPSPLVPTPESKSQLIDAMKTFAARLLDRRFREWRMKTWFFIPAALALLTSACATAECRGFLSVVWRAAPDPQLALFHAPNRQDVLVRYAEEGDGTNVTTRAYYLAPNVAKIYENQKPQFVDPRETDGLVQIPLLPRAKNFSDDPLPNSTNLLARPIASGRGFTLIRHGRESAAFTLPNYYQFMGPPRAIATLSLVPLMIPPLAFTRCLGGEAEVRTSTPPSPEFPSTSRARP